MDFPGEPQQLEKSVEIITRNVRNWIVFSAFAWVSFTLLVFPGSKKRTEIENLSPRIFRSMIPILRECQKAHLVLKFLETPTHFSPKTRNYSVISLSIEHHQLVKSLFFAKFLTRVLHDDLVRLVMPEKLLLGVHNLKFQKIHLSTYAGSISTIKLSNKTFFLCGKPAHWSNVIFFHASESWWYETSKKPVKLFHNGFQSCVFL